MNLLNMVFLHHIQWQTPAGRSIQYTQKMASILGNNAHTSTPIVSMKKIFKGNDITYELFTSGSKSVGVFDQVVFACHSPQALEILKPATVVGKGDGVDPDLLDALDKIEYGDNVVYVHSDPNLMPQRKAAWGSWNCMGKSELLSTHSAKDSKKKKNEAMEGAASGFGNKLIENGNGHSNVSSDNGTNSKLPQENLEGKNACCLCHILHQPSSKSRHRHRCVRLSQPSHGTKERTRLSSSNHGASSIHT
jgi:hypothetical protein